MRSSHSSVQSGCKSGISDVDFVGGQRAPVCVLSTFFLVILVSIVRS